MTKVVHCKKSDYDVYIGRGKCPKTGKWGEWGNPFKIGIDGNREEVCKKYKEWFLNQPQLVEKAKKELKGKILACWCYPFLCHGNIIAEIIDVE